MAEDVVLEKRTHVYVQRPQAYEISGCMKCGNLDPDWSEYSGHLWCQNCQVDFRPEQDGVFGGPISIKVCELVGIYFDKINLETGELEPDPDGIFHFKFTAQSTAQSAIQQLGAEQK